MKKNEMKKRNFKFTLRKFLSDDHFYRIYKAWNFDDAWNQYLADPSLEPSDSFVTYEIIE